jgi:methionyl-tRNA formyltransferase
LKLSSNEEIGQTTYLVLGSKPWNRRVFEEEICRLPGDWFYIGSPHEFSFELVRQKSPRYLFFLHWSWKVPDEILQNFECVCFHMTEVPYGRGGSPLQNLIIRGLRETKLTAFRMTSELDAGPVYTKEPLSLEGSAEEIYIRAGRLSAAMIGRMIQEEVHPLPQQGEVVEFKRRKPEESAISAPASLQELYNFIRMLDADGYPHAFLDYGGFHFEFTRAALYDGRVAADVKITPIVTRKEPAEE